ncbi:hypothetical protein AVEN_129471-1 [Araneus ventricosus]|uniref:Uncharacterized protein n=1 Tax=Araneus ventricosus TaxID=182803 RepID=A0A4Y2X744_ARAVE|nr:hypothetical protein AVEN_129471-1 [Araneus ventricosus]
MDGSASIRNNQMGSRMDKFIPSSPHFGWEGREMLRLDINSLNSHQHTIPGDVLVDETCTVQNTILVGSGIINSTEMGTPRFASAAALRFDQSLIIKENPCVLCNWSLYRADH